MEADDEGGGFIGTPLEPLPRHGGSSRARRQTLADRLAPVAAAYASGRERAATNAERDALRDIYRAPDERLPTALPATGRLTRDDLMDDEDRAHALRRKRPDGSPTAAGGGWVGVDAELPEIVALPSRVSVGYAILRAQGHGGGDGVAQFEGRGGAERRRKYRLGDMLAAVTAGGTRGYAGVGYEEDGGMATNVRPFSRAAKSLAVALVVGAGGRGVDGDGDDDDDDVDERERVRGSAAHADDEPLFMGGDDEDVFGDARDGSLDAAASRMRAAMKRDRHRHAATGRRPKPPPARRARDEGTGEIDLSAWDIMDGYEEDRTAPSVDAETAALFPDTSALPAVPAAFARNPRHDWEHDLFRDCGTLYGGGGGGGGDNENGTGVVRTCAQRVAAAERARVAALGAAAAARRASARRRRAEAAARVRTTAGAGLRSGFVSAGSAGGGAAGSGERIAVGEARRTAYAWKPEAVLCRRLGVGVPVPRGETEVGCEADAERGAPWRSRRRARWKEATGVDVDVVGGDGDGDGGAIRVRSIVSRDGQVAVVDDGGVDGVGIVVGDGSDGSDGEAGGVGGVGGGGVGGGGVGGGRDDDDDDDDDGDGVEEARRALRAAVFGQVREVAGVAGVDEEGGPAGAGRRWRAADFF